jgi:hypothetical protein
LPIDGGGNMSVRDVVTIPRSRALDAGVSSSGDACLNCGGALAGPYCSQCGQKVPTQDLKLRDFLHETTHELTDWDGKVPRTLKALLLRPGLLTADYLAGKRARWLPPLRLYLWCSLIFFLSGPAVEAVTHRSFREAAKLTIKNADGTTKLTPETRKEIANALPGRIFGVDRMERAATHSAELNQTIQATFPKAMFVLLPLFALLTSVAWRRQRRGYPAHVYLALHLHSAWFLAFTAVTIVAAFVESSAVQGLLALAGFIYIVWYLLVALHTVFGESWRRTITKAALVVIAYGPCWLAASLVIFGYAIATM